MTDNPSTATETDPQAELERRFQRLLWAYPRRYRRRRGEELLATLLESCAEDQQHPSPAQRRHILRSGLSCRFRVRGGKAHVVLAVFLALITAVIGSWVGARLGWVGQPDPPTAKETAAIAAEAFDDMEPDEVYGDDAPFAHGLELAMENTPVSVALFGGDTYRRGRQIAEYEKSLSMKEWKTKAPQVVGNLEAAGWHIKDEDYTKTTDGLEDFDVTAVRDGQIVEIIGAGYGPWFEVVVVHTVPASQSVGLGVGALFGLLAGWLFAVRIAWQITVVNPRRRTLAVTLLFTPLPFALGIFVISVVAAVESLQAAPTDVDRPPWYPLMDLPYRPLCWISAVLILAAIVAAMLPGRNRGQRLDRARQDAAIG